jgi:hypothetical protein
MKLQRLSKEFLGEFEYYNFSRIGEKRVGLVGSAKFKEYFIKLESILQILYNKLVSICSLDGLLNKEKFCSDEWEALQRICIDKLKDQSALLVIDINGYIGTHTAEEIEYFTKRLKKPIYYLSKLAVK